MQEKREMRDAGEDWGDGGGGEERGGAGGEPYLAKASRCMRARWCLLSASLSPAIQCPTGTGRVGESVRGRTPTCVAGASAPLSYPLHVRNVCMGAATSMHTSLVFTGACVRACVLQQGHSVNSHGCLRGFDWWDVWATVPAPPPPPHRLHRSSCPQGESEAFLQEHRYTCIGCVCVLARARSRLSHRVQA